MASNTSDTARMHRIRRYGEWACVTGASSGIGREIAIRLAEAGVHLVLAARRADLLEALAAELAQKHGTRSKILALDLADSAAITRIVDETSGIDVGLLVCSAGFGSSGPLIKSELADELNMVDVNCRALLALTWHFGRRFASQKRGGIILMSSLLGFQGVPGAVNYAATKAYVQSLAEGLRHELAPLNVHVLASAPGPIHTGFASRARMTMGMAQRPVNVAQATLNALGRRTTVRPGLLSKALEWSLKPLPRWGRVRMLGVVMKGMVPKQQA